MLLVTVADKQNSPLINQPPSMSECESVWGDLGDIRREMDQSLFQVPCAAKGVTVVCLGCVLAE